MTGSEFLLTPRTAAAAGGGAVVTSFLLDGAAVPFFGVGMTTLGMAVAGSLLAFAYGTPVKGPWKLFGYSIGGMFLGVWGVHLLPAMFGWEWYYELGPSVAQPPMAGVIALLSRWAIPLIVENLPAVWNRVFNTGAKNSAGEKS